MNWVEVKRKAKQRTAPGRCEEEARTSWRTVQVFVKVDGCKLITTEVELKDKVSDSVKRIPNSASCSKIDVYAMCQGRVLRRSDELRCQGWKHGAAQWRTAQRQGRRGQNHRRDSWSRRTQDNLESDRSQVGKEYNDDKVIQAIEKREEYEKIIMSVAARNDTEVEQKMQRYMAIVRRISGLDEEHTERFECRLRREVETRRHRARGDARAERR